MTDHERIVSQQGSTFLWTEGYGSPSRRTALLEEARDLAFAGALLLLAAGVASFLGIQSPTRVGASLLTGVHLL
jgi:hypothetical protein